MARDAGTWSRDQVGGSSQAAEHQHCGTYRSGEELEASEGMGAGHSRGIGSLQGHHKNQKEEEGDDVEQQKRLEEEEIGEHAGTKAATDLLQSVVPRLCGMDQCQEPVPEGPAALGSVGTQLRASCSCTASITTSSGNCAADLQARCSPGTMHMERWVLQSGCVAPGCSSSGSAASCPEQGASGGAQAGRSPVQTTGTYRRLRFSSRLRGSSSSTWLRCAGGRLDSSFASRLCLSEGTETQRDASNKTHHAHPEPYSRRMLTCQRGVGRVGLQIILPQAGPCCAAELLQGWTAAPTPQPRRAVVVLRDNGPTAAPCGRNTALGWAALGRTPGRAHSMAQPGQEGHRGGTGRGWHSPMVRLGMLARIRRVVA